MSIKSLATKFNSIKDILSIFNGSLLKEKHTGMAGGTLISMLNNNFRNSQDIDFVCTNNKSFLDLKALLRDGEDGLKQIANFNEKIKLISFQANKGIIKMILGHQNGEMIKVEIINMYDVQELGFDFQLDNEYSSELTNSNSENNIWYMNNESLFFLKFGALLDRGLQFPFKDYFDILALYENNQEKLPSYSLFMSFYEIDQNFDSYFIKIFAQSILNKQTYIDAGQALEMNEEYLYHYLNETNYKFLNHFIDFTFNLNQNYLDKLSKIENVLEHIIEEIQDKRIMNNQMGEPNNMTLLYNNINETLNNIHLRKAEIETNRINNSSKLSL